MAPIRVRHAKGVDTLDIDLDTASVADLQAKIFSLSEIPPASQLIKLGYPPRPLTLVPELPLSSLGITRGEQIIVTSASAPAPPPPPFPALPQVTGNVVAATTPLQQTAPPAPSRTAGGPDFVHTDAGVLIHRIVPDDNSCLFSAVAIAFTQDMANARAMRTIAAEGVTNDPDTYNEAILGMPPAQYTAKIKQPNTWGGAIELAVLARHFGAEISSIDVETGRIDRFRPEHGADTRCVLVYSGIHYDAASLAPSPDAPEEWHQTVFPIESDDETDAILVAAKKLADILRSKKAYTNTATFDLKCEQCGQGLKGEKGARAHAEQTGHTRFGEY
ncbi:hypothetical protein HGRIS_012870 [Hohenbuehelia grisea]|uniref:Ubiquitin thioesterase OTU n=1 Tax=Hohenbuehelia grisea TaxID=104357 RepID=A0ABR3ITU1_9AGAR